MEPKPTTVTAAAILRGVWHESGGTISVEEAVQKCTAKRVDAAELQQFATFAKRVADAVATTEDMEESERKEMTMGDVESAPAATPMEAVSQYAGVFEQVLDLFLTNKRILKSLIKVDFSKCSTAFDAITAVTDVYNKGQRAPKIPGGDVVKLHQLFQAAVDAFDKKKTDETLALSTDNMSLSLPFKSKYIGDANKQFYNYVNQCWETYTTRHDNYRYPYCAIVQSSGFGKTRLLRELAVQFQRDEETRSVAKTAAPATERQRLVYVNVRQPSASSGYPRRTEALATHFFTTMKTKTDEMVVELADKLLQLFQFVMQPGVARAPDTTDSSSSSMPAKLMKLFDAEDKEFTQNLQAVSTAFSKQPPTDRHVLVFAVDEARVLLPTLQDDGIGMDWLRILRRALKLASTTIRVQYSNVISSTVKSGIFGIVVDTDATITQISEYDPPPAIMDPSQRRLVPKKLLLFPPFVLTHTMDVLHATTIDTYGGVLPVHQPDQADQTTLKRYQNEVTTAIAKLPLRGCSWKRLSQLGRPLWLKLDAVTMNTRQKLVESAAQKLLCGKLPYLEGSFNDKTLNGVASLLCRVGIRPYASSSLAATVVADFMAVLSYVGSASETLVASYSSDPILTLGATCVWHRRGCGRTLAEKILPQLRRMLSQEVVDTGGSGGSGTDEMVARIVLLLAMDACHLLESEQDEEHNNVSHWSGAGEFFSVWTFLTALQGDAPGLLVVKDDDDQVMETTKPVVLVDASREQAVAACAAVETRWKDWCVSFTHFVQLAHVPSEACLWAMLGRRAAGIMPRGLKGAVDLVIPICTVGDQARARVSMIFVQVENPQRQDAHACSFVSAATVNMHPSKVFGKPQPHQTSRLVDTTDADTETKRGERARAEEEEETAGFAALGPDSVLRVYMSLRSKRVRRFYLEDKCGGGGDADGGAETSYVLCLKGLAPTSALPLRSSDHHHVRPKPVDVLTRGVVDELTKLWPQWWNAKTLVEQDVEWRDEEELRRCGLTKRGLVALALKPMAEVVLLNCDDAVERISATESALGRVSVEVEDTGDPRSGENHRVTSKRQQQPVSESSTGGKSKRSSESESSTELPSSKRTKKQQRGQ